MTTGIRYAKAGTICIASSTGVIARSNRFESPVRTPSGTPTRSERPTAASMSAKVCMLSSHSPVSANVANAPPTHAAARQPPNRSAIAVPTTVVPSQVSHRSNLSNHSTRWSTNVENPSKTAKTTFGSSAFRWSSSQVWKSSRWNGSEFHVSPSGHGYSSPHARYARYMSATIPAVCTILPRHQGRWTTTGAAETASAATVVTASRPAPRRSPRARRRDRRCRRSVLPPYSRPASRSRRAPVLLSASSLPRRASGRPWGLRGRARA